MYTIKLDYLLLIYPVISGNNKNERAAIAVYEGVERTFELQCVPVIKQLKTSKFT